MSFSLNCEHMTLFIESLNYYIYNKLKFRNRSSLIVQFMVEISEIVYNFLQKEFLVSKLFKQKDIIIDELGLINERKINERNKIQINRFYFMIRLHKKRDLQVQDRVLHGKRFLCVKFSKKEVVF